MYVNIVLNHTIASSARLRKETHAPPTSSSAPGPDVSRRRRRRSRLRRRRLRLRRRRRRRVVLPRPSLRRALGGSLLPSRSLLLAFAFFPPAAAGGRERVELQPPQQPTVSPPFGQLALKRAQLRGKPSVGARGRSLLFHRAHRLLQARPLRRHRVRGDDRRASAPSGEAVHEDVPSVETRARDKLEASLKVRA
eukprot:19150-Pelagococcus_subviridis.AAC.1